VRREQAQIIRLVLMCLAWSLGQMLTLGLGVSFVDTVVPAALAIGVYVVTDDLGKVRVTGGEEKYWRGRRIDDDDNTRGRWN
jgi:hypothetical protein